MGSGLISVAVTGVNAAQAALLTTSNNISNLNTEGYSRQRTVQAAGLSVMTGAGGFGQGVQVLTVERMYSEAVTRQVLNAQTSVSSLDTYSAQIGQIDNMLADKEVGLTPLVQGFFDAVQSVASSPSLITSRQTLVSSAETMVQGFQSIYSRLTELESGVNTQLSNVVNSINSYTGQIADINQRILTTNAIYNQPANDLLDKRDQLVADLNKLVKVTIRASDDGSYNIFVGTGQALVMGSRATTLAAVPSAADASRMAVALNDARGGKQELPDTFLNGGELGGLLSFRSEALDAAFNQLGLQALSMAQTFNAQHELGLDLSGVVGGEFFTVAEPVVSGGAKNPAGSPVVAATLTPPLSNGSNFYTDLTDSDYELAFDGSNLTLTRRSDGVVWPKPPATATTVDDINAALTNDPQGFTLSADSGFGSGRYSYLVRPTRNAAQSIAVASDIVSDPRKIAAGQTPLTLANTAGNQGALAIESLTSAAAFQSLVDDGTGKASTLTYDASTQTVSGLPDGFSAAVEAGTVNGASRVRITVTSGSDTLILSGGFESGSATFSWKDTGVEDGSNAVKFGNLQTQNTTLGGAVTYQDAYAAFVNDIGNKTASANNASKAQTVLLEQASAARESVSGVNRDEEAAHLIEYQQAYQASAKVLETASKLFDTLLSIS